MNLDALQTMTRSMAQLDRAAGSGAAAQGSAAAASGADFKSVLGRMVEQAEVSQSEASAKVTALARGEPQDVHSVMTALNEADLSFRLVLEVRNKIVEAYQEIKRMPI
jgi:flagellar hook-basal body complex protein FliE